MQMFNTHEESNGDQQVAVKRKPHATDRLQPFIMLDAFYILQVKSVVRQDVGSA